MSGEAALRQHAAHAAVASPGVMLDQPPATRTPLARRFADALARAPAFDRCAWSETLRSLTLADAADLLRFHPEAATRTLLARSPEGEVTLACCLPGQEIAAQPGEDLLVHVLAGQGEAQCGELHEGQLRAGAPAPFRAGEQLQVCGGLHRIRNTGSGILVTLHVRAPP